MKRAILLLAVTASACDPLYRVRADVKSVAACGATATPPEPVIRASVTLQCQGGTAHPLGTTDGEGHLSFAAVGTFGKDCLLTVTKHGFTPRTYHVDDVCAAHDGDRCWLAAFTADLSPNR